MILTITYEGKNTQDLGYLLYKNPSRPQAFDLSMGKAYIFYPEISDEKTTIALILDLDPMDLAKGKAGSKEGGLFDYVNDRPYVSSSFMSNAIGRVFGTAMTGRCDARQELADSELDLAAKLSMLPVRGDKSLINDIFTPLGYQVFFESFPVDEKYPAWGESVYVNLTIEGKKRISELLNQLYVLIPVFDRQRHYYVSESEVDNLLKHGKGWLDTHPLKEYIIKRYFANVQSYANLALNRINGTKPGSGGHEKRTESSELMEDLQEDHIPLDKERLETVCREIVAQDARSVIDLGCGEGKLLQLLINEHSIKKISGMDVSTAALKKAADRLHYDRMNEYEKERLVLFQGSLLYEDERFKGYDAACAVEVIEHIDPERIPCFEEILFNRAKPKTVIVTTPNHDYNKHYEFIGEELRHTDHRFEWSRKEFEKWALHICEKYGYNVAIKGVGTESEDGQPTQMGVFTR